MLAGFPVLEIDQIVRRTIRGSIVICAIAGAVVWAAFHQPLFLPGLAVGLVCAVANHRLFQASAMRYASEEGQLARKPFAGATLFRLGVCTAIAVVLIVLVRPMGWGDIAALAIFQFVMLANALAALFAFKKRELDV